MRVATWNINGLRARLDFVLIWLRDRQPDVVLLQELRSSADVLPELELKAAGYHMAAHAQRGRNGVAVLSRDPIEVIVAGLPSHDEAGARLLDTRSGGLRLLSAYVPNGKSVTHPDFKTKLAWLDGLAAYVAGPDGEGDVILGGDLNIAPSALDTWDEESFRGRIFHTDAERARFTTLLEAGLVDAFRHVHPGTRLFSWWDYRAGDFHNGRGLRIDFLLASPGVQRRVTDVWIDRDYRKKKEGLIPSDHAPVVAELS